MRGIRWAPFALYIEGAVTTSIGWMRPWIDFGGADHNSEFNSWRNGHVISNIGAGARLMESIFAFGLIGVGVYWLVLGLQRRLSKPGTEVSTAAAASAVIAVVGFVCTAYMIVRTYQYADAWVPPTVVERPDGPMPHATVTLAPWLLLGGHASFIVAGRWLSRVVQRWRTEP